MFPPSQRPMAGQMTNASYIRASPALYNEMLAGDRVDRLAAGPYISVFAAAAMAG